MQEDKFLAPTSTVRIWPSFSYKHKPLWEPCPHCQEHPATPGGHSQLSTGARPNVFQPLPRYKLRTEAGLKGSPCCRANHADQGRGKSLGCTDRESRSCPGRGCSFGLPYVSDLLSSELDFVFLEELSAREQEKRRERYRKYGDQT